MKIVFFGTPEFGAVILKKLIEAGLKPVFAITVPDKPAGRKQLLTPPPVKVVAEQYGIPLLQTNDLTNKTYVQTIRKAKPDLIILASYGVILPKEVLELPKHGALNVHPSLLPKYRGPSPVQETILKGEEITGVTIMLIDEEIDHGSILAQREFSIFNFQFSNGLGTPTTSELKEKLAELGGELLIEVIPLWIQGTIKPKAQDHSKATFTKRIQKKDGKIDWTKDARFIARQIRAYHPWPGTFCLWGGKRIKILKGKAGEPPGKQSFRPGTVIPCKEGFGVQTGRGVLLVERLQIEGRNEASFRDFLRGYSRFIGSTLA